MTPRLKGLFDEYASAHRHPTNQLTHKIAIPLIVFHVVAMMNWIPIGELTGGIVGIILAGAWYFRQDPRIGSVMSLFMVACLAVGRVVPAEAVIAIAVGAWIVQFSGHYVWEKQQPSFFTNILQALVGPAFFTAKILKIYGP
jgi:uncharacterized membrane protein YGL010W